MSDSEHDYLIETFGVGAEDPEEVEPIEREED